MNKTVKSLAVLLSVGFIAACGAGTSSSSDDTTIADPEETIKELKKAVRDALNSDIKSYSYSLRKYQADFRLGIADDDYLVKYNITNYADSICGTYKYTKYSSGCYEPVIDFMTKGTMAFYRDGDYCYYGNQSENPVEDFDGIAIIEYTPFVDMYSLWGDFELFGASGGISAFTNLNLTYATSYGYYEKTETVERTSDGGYLLSISTGAPAEGQYSEEEILYTAVFDKNSVLTEINYDYNIWTGAKNEEAVEDPFTGINRHDHITMNNFVFGAHDGTNDFAFDIDSSIYVNDNRSHIVDIGEDDVDADGKVSDAKVLEILDNITAYTKGTVSSSLTATYSNYISYDDDWNATGLGPAKETTEFTLYNDYIMTIEGSMVFQSDPDTPSTTYVQYFLNKNNDLAVRQILNGDTEGIYYSTVDGDTVASSIHYYLDPNGAFLDGSLVQFTTLDSDTDTIGTTTRKNKSTYIDGKLTIDVTYTFKPKAAYEAYCFKMNKEVIYTFDENFFLESVYDKNYLQNPDEPECTSISTYTNVKGELTDFDGELLIPDVE